MKFLKQVSQKVALELYLQTIVKDLHDLHCNVKGTVSPGLTIAPFLQTSYVCG